MSSEEASAKLAAFQERHKATNEHPTDDYLTIHVNDLIGATGEQLTASQEDWKRFEQSNAHGDPITPLKELSTNSLIFKDDSPNDCWTDEEFEARGAERILGALAARKAAFAQETFTKAVGNMMEPVRTVAVNLFYVAYDKEELARQLETSVETVEFLSQVALAQLERHVKIVE